MSFWIENAMASSLMPPAATEVAHEVTNLYIFLLIYSFIGFLVLIGGMCYFIVRYRRESNSAKSAYITHNSVAEFLWSFIPLCLFLVCFVWGWIVFHKIRSMPENALEIYVQGRQWAWDFQYKSGRRANELYVPVGEPIKLIMTSNDVIHSFYVPAFRIKQDVIPGRYTTLWFNIDKPGNYQVFCAEYCGAAHSAMLTKVRAVPRVEFDKWLGNDPDKASKGLSMAQIGEKLFASKGCVACHSVDGSVKVGPSLKAVYNHEVPLVGGTAVKADEAYLRESILNPNAKIVLNFAQGVMPVFAGQLKDDELNSLVEYLKSLQ